MPQYDPVARKVYVNLQDENIFCGHRSSDGRSRRAVSGGPMQRKPGMPRMTLTRSITAPFFPAKERPMNRVRSRQAPADCLLPMAGGPDVIKFDPGLKRSTPPARSGAISVFQMDDLTITASWRTYGSEEGSQLAIDPENSPRLWPEQEADGKQSPEWLFTKQSCIREAGFR